MSFEDAKTYMDFYRKHKAKAMNNEERIVWFTDGVASIEELLDTKFSSSKENDDWLMVYKTNENKDKSKDKVRGYSTRIAFLTGCRRDLNTLLSASAARRIRTVSDYDRFEYCRLPFVNIKMDKLKTITDGQIKGEK